MLSLTVSTSYESIIPGLTQSPALYWHLVRFIHVLYRVFSTLLAVLHHYYKLAYIKVLWGGAEEKAAEIEDGNLDANDWQDEAYKIVENTVGCPIFCLPRLTTT
jgi:hypothetical protein